MKFKRIASGVYETEDKRFYMYRVPDVYPPAWNVENTETFEMIANGAATMRDAIWFFEQAQA